MASPSDAALSSAPTPAWLLTTRAISTLRYPSEIAFIMACRLVPRPDTSTPSLCTDCGLRIADCGLRDPLPFGFPHSAFCTCLASRPQNYSIVPLLLDHSPNR